MNYKEFKNKVKSMTAHDIIMAMVEGLRKPRTKIDMDTFGEIREGTYFGCAATNAILHIMEAEENEVEDFILARVFVDYWAGFLNKFEDAIDWLRRGMLGLYNSYAFEAGFAPITPIPGQELPWLYNDYTEGQLQEYEKLAKHQLTV